MTSGKKVTGFLFSSVPFFFSLFISTITGTTGTATAANPEQRFIQIAAKNKEERSSIANTGVTIEAVRTDSVWAFGNESSIRRLKEAGHDILANLDLEVARGGHQEGFGFPTRDSRFHDYQEMMTALQELHSRHPDITQLLTIGKSIENRDIVAIHINTSERALNSGTSSKPGVVYMGNHHAREHLSAEVPLMLAEFLLANRNDAKIGDLLANRDIWIIPMINPDGVEWDISSSRYKWWRKNRRNNGNGAWGVDLNRNYGFKWGTGGSTIDPTSDVYMGEAPFSEPETQAVRDFVSARPNLKMLLSFHTFSELILIPWGHTYYDITNPRDQAVFLKMAKTMATWNNYTPLQASDLYITSGDTTDWAYGERGIFAFTFELSPKSMGDGGFYPGAKIIDRVFEANVKPCLYMLDLAADPYRVLKNEPTGFLQSYVQPAVSTQYEENSHF